MAGTYSLKRFLQKTPGAQRNTKINEKRNGVITLSKDNTNSGKYNWL